MSCPASIPKTLYFVDVIGAVSKQFREIDPLVMEFENVQHRIGVKAICLDDTVRLCLLEMRPHLGK
jgi:hypothetical protein